LQGLPGLVSPFFGSPVPVWRRVTCELPLAVLPPKADLARLIGDILPVGRQRTESSPLLQSHDLQPGRQSIMDKREGLRDINGMGQTPLSSSLRLREQQQHLISASHSAPWLGPLLAGTPCHVPSPGQRLCAEPVRAGKDLLSAAEVAKPPCEGHSPPAPLTSARARVCAFSFYREGKASKYKLSKEES